MKAITLSEGTGRTRVSLSTNLIGDDPVVCIFNEIAHMGAVAVADYSTEENRASTSVITRLGHKDDVVACRAAQKICRALKKPVCVVAGIHLDDITDDEIAEVVRNCDRLAERAAAALAD